MRRELVSEMNKAPVTGSTARKYLCVGLLLRKGIQKSGSPIWSHLLRLRLLNVRGKHFVSSSYRSYLCLKSLFLQRGKWDKSKTSVNSHRRAAKKKLWCAQQSWTMGRSTLEKQHPGQFTFLPLACHPLCLAWGFLFYRMLQSSHFTCRNHPAFPPFHLLSFSSPDSSFPQ